MRSCGLNPIRGGSVCFMLLDRHGHGSALYTEEYVKGTGEPQNSLAAPQEQKRSCYGRGMKR